ncbi:UNVERIFIED_CONTAM: hypothetical protein H355_009444 [Colinus virginianus]|nr:hypothetical protein H355_009444 [Colinus virginianus]
MATSRPVVTVYSPDNGAAVSSALLPAVFCSPLRPDLVRYVHANIGKNRRQAYGVSPSAGYQTSAESWGTGRAVARIPRVPGGGTHRAGQAAFGNMCRGGGMFAPNKTWRRWHRHINVTERRHAAAAAIAATGLPALVMARGHRVDSISELPLVVSDELQQITKTSKALQVLRVLGCDAELERLKVSSTQLRAGRGKMRGRRYNLRRGPLVIYAEDNGISRALRNLPGVDSCHVDRLSVLQLAPGGSLGRFCIWTAAAFHRLQLLYGSSRPGASRSGRAVTVVAATSMKTGDKETKPQEAGALAAAAAAAAHTGEAALKKGYRLPRALMSNADLGRIINSEEVQAAVRPAIKCAQKKRVQKNLLTNRATLCRMNPAAAHLKRLARLAQKPGSRQHAVVQKKKKSTLQQHKEHRRAAKSFAQEIATVFSDKMAEELEKQARQKAEMAGAMAEAMSEE